MDAGKIAALERAMDDCLLAVYLPMFTLYGGI